MNYFAHGRRFLGEPYFLAGTAVPDWVRVAERRARAPGKRAAPHVDDPDPRIADLARGVLRHHHDDGWFHQTRAFVELSLAFAVELRDRLPGDAGMRPSFVGHILVEILLDATLIEEAPQDLVGYYDALAALDAAVIGAAAERLTTRPAPLLAAIPARFCGDRFLYDYADDGKLLARLNRVMRRVGLAELPAAAAEMFPAARLRVAARRDELLAGEGSAVPAAADPGRRPAGAATSPPSRSPAAAR